jgi:16S rRNA (cytidine1402-2'-O)-methyltransferase
MNKSNLVFGTMPIGNIVDSTYNLIDYIKNSDIIAVENKEPVQEIIDHYNLTIRGKIISISPKNFMTNGMTSDRLGLIESQRVINAEILDYINSGKVVLCLSDEGSPIVVDPFDKIRQLAIQENIKYKVLPGPSSVISSISCSKLYDGESFSFYGMIFYNPKKAEIYKSIKESLCPSVLFYHHEIQDIFFKELAHNVGLDREITLVSNLTTDKEFVLEGTVSDIIDFVSKNHVLQPTLIISGKS